jgi:hypothetical protein
MGGKIRIVVKVAQQRDAESFKPRRPASQRDVLAHDTGKIGLDQRGIGGKGGDSGSRRETDKFSSGGGKKSQFSSGFLRRGIVWNEPALFSIAESGDRDMPEAISESEVNRGHQIYAPVRGSAR